MRASSRLFPLLEMFGFEETDHVGPDAIIPDYRMAVTVDHCCDYGELPTFTPKDAAIDWAKQCRGAVTITLREAVHFPARNNRVLDWIEVAKWLSRQGDRVVIIRDTAKAAEPIVGAPRRASFLRSSGRAR
jgi:hypothetical protein